MKNYIKSSSPGVYILLVCRSSNYYTFLSEYKKNPDFKTFVHDYLSSKNTLRIVDRPFKRFEPILHEMIRNKVTLKQIVPFLNGDTPTPSLLTLSRQHSDTTDLSEKIIHDVRMHKEKLRTDIHTARQEGDNIRVRELTERLEQLPLSDEAVRTAAYKIPVHANYEDEIDGGKSRKIKKSKRKTKRKTKNYRLKL